MSKDASGEASPHMGRLIGERDMSEGGEEKC